MSKQNPVVVMSGGGSGGHITPVLSLAHVLKQKNPGCQIIYVGHKGDNFDSLNLPKHDFDFLVFLNAGKFRRYHGESFWSHLTDIKTLFLNIRDFFRVIKSIGSAYRMLGKFKADVVFSKGGFVSVPVGLAARLRGIPIITHDSDAIPGLANRIVGRWAAVRATGTPTDLYKKIGKSKLVYTGIPLDARIQPVNASAQAKYKNQLGLPSDAKVLLIGGAGNGSEIINNMVLASAPELLSQNLDLHILHLAGPKLLKSVQNGYKSELEPALFRRVKTLGFTPDFYIYSGASDVIISRAGATALAEFALQGKACIIIPSPFLAGGHQLKNAKLLSDNDAAAVLGEDTAPDELIAVANRLLNDERRRTELSRNLHAQAKPGAAEALAKIILERV